MVVKKRKTNYVNNKDFLAAIVEHRRKVAAGEDPKLSNYIGECIVLIAKKLSNKYNFSGYSYKEEMISDGIENSMMYFANFDPAKSSNPFAYFTQIIRFSFIRRIQKEKKQQYVKLKNIQNHFTLHEWNNDQNDYIDRDLYENNHLFIEKFEKTLTDKKKKGKLAGVEKFLVEDEDHG